MHIDFKNLLFPIKNSVSLLSIHGCSRLWKQKELPQQCNGTTTRITWDQAQFERFSYILSNGYRDHARRNVIYKAKRKQSLISGYNKKYNKEQHKTKQDRPLWHWNTESPFGDWPGWHPMITALRGDLSRYLLQQINSYTSRLWTYTLCYRLAYLRYAF